MPPIMKAAGQFGRQTFQIIADTETDGGFTPAWKKKRLFNIKRQQITLKSAGQTQKGIMILGKQSDFQEEVLGETVNITRKKIILQICLIDDDLICMFWKKIITTSKKKADKTRNKQLCRFKTKPKGVLIYSFIFHTCFTPTS